MLEGNDAMWHIKGTYERRYASGGDITASGVEVIECLRVYSLMPRIEITKK